MFLTTECLSIRVYLSKRLWNGNVLATLEVRGFCEGAIWGKP